MEGIAEATAVTAISVLQGGGEGDCWTGHQVQLVANTPCNKNLPVSKRSESDESLLHSAVQLQNTVPQEDMQHAGCAVCGDKANGNFFGATVCLPCKSFFIRCTKEGEAAIQKQCDGCCDVSKELRNRCQFCRFQRCLHIGMSRKEKPVVVHPEEGQELCRVCGDLANGVHFGIFTCEGCKKFFRRGLKEHKSYACRGSQDCKLNPRNRNNCRACRFRKCAAVGMSRDAIKMGRPRKMFDQAKTNSEMLGMSSLFSREEMSDNRQTCDSGQLPGIPAGTPPQQALDGSPQRGQPDVHAEKDRYPTWTLSAPTLSRRPEEASCHQWLVKSDRASAELFCGEPSPVDQEQTGRDLSFSNVGPSPIYGCLMSEPASRRSLSQVSEHKTFCDPGSYGALYRPNAASSMFTQPAPLYLPLHTDVSAPSARTTPEGSEFPALDATSCCSLPGHRDQTYRATSAPGAPGPGRTMFAYFPSHRVLSPSTTEGVLDLSVRTSIPIASQETGCAHAYNHSPSFRWRRPCLPRAEKGVAALITGTGSETVYEPGTTDGPDRGMKIARMSTEAIRVPNRRSPNVSPRWAVQSRPKSKPSGCFLSASEGPIDLSAVEKLPQSSVIGESSHGTCGETVTPALSPARFGMIGPSSEASYRWRAVKNSSEYFHSTSSKLPAETLSFFQAEMSAASCLATDVNGMWNGSQVSTEVLDYSRFKSANKHAEIVVMNGHRTVSPSFQYANVRHAADWCFKNYQHCLGSLQQTNSSRPYDGYRSDSYEYFQEPVPDETRCQEQPAFSQGHHFKSLVDEAESRMPNSGYAGMHTIREGSEGSEIGQLEWRTPRDATPCSDIQMLEELLRTRFDFSLVRLREYCDKMMKLPNFDETGQSEVRKIPDICRLIIKDVVASPEDPRNGANEKLDVDANCHPEGMWRPREEEQNRKCAQAHTLPDVPGQTRFALPLSDCLQGDKAALSKEEQDSPDRQARVGEQVVALLRRYADCLEWLDRALLCRDKKLPDSARLQESLEACGTEALRAAPQSERGCSACCALPCLSRKRRL